MQLPDPMSSLWADKILWMLGGGGVVGGLVALANLILNRNKPKAEIAKTVADTQLTQAEITVKLSNQLALLHDRMNLTDAGVDQRQRETAEAINGYTERIQILEAERNLLQAQLDERIRIGKQG